MGLYFRLCHSSNISSVRECTCLIVFDRPSLGFCLFVFVFVLFLFLFFFIAKCVFGPVHTGFLYFLVYELGFNIDTKPVTLQKMVSNIFPTLPPPDHGLAMYVIFIFSMWYAVCVNVFGVIGLIVQLKKIFL